MISHLLEPSLQGRVLLDELAVLVKGGSADTTELAAGQEWLYSMAGQLGITASNKGSGPCNFCPQMLPTP